VARKASKKVKEESKDKENKISSSGAATEMAMKSLKKKFGAVLGWMDSKQEEERVIIPTGSLRLDDALGIGGILLGRLYEIFGNSMGGKSTLCLSIAREAIRLGHKVIYVDAEQALDSGEQGLLAKMGIDQSKVALVQAYTAEDNLDIAAALIGTGEFSLCIIDSISSLQPSAEANLESFGDNLMMNHPKLMSKMCRTFTPLCKRTNTAFLMINQIRISPTSYGSGEVTPGGKAIGFHSSVRIKVIGGGTKSRLIMDRKGVAIGQQVTLDVVKNKLAPPYKKAETELTFGKGFSRDSELFDLAVEMGFIDKAGAWYSYEGSNIGQGKEKSMAFLQENKDIYDKVENSVQTLLTEL
jgi:recombination protein RecA